MKQIAPAFLACLLVLCVSSCKRADAQPTQAERARLAEIEAEINRGESCTVNKDTVGAESHYRKAAELGSAAAQYLLGGVYTDGEGIPKNSAEAMKWFRKAADQGYALGQVSVGLMYEQGDGVPKNTMEAANWYRLAADQGDADGQRHLGMLMGGGNMGVKYLRLAANQGDYVAAYNLGIVFYKGQGVPKDSVEGLAWVNFAAVSGAPAMVDTRDEWEREIGVEGTLAAQKRTKEIQKERAAANR